MIKVNNGYGTFLIGLAKYQHNPKRLSEYFR